MDRRDFLARCAVIPASVMATQVVPRLVEIWCWTEAAGRFWFSVKTDEGKWLATVFDNPAELAAMVERALVVPFA